MTVRVSSSEMPYRGAFITTLTSFSTALKIEVPLPCRKNETALRLLHSSLLRSGVAGIHCSVASAPSGMVLVLLSQGAPSSVPTSSVRLSNPMATNTLKGATGSSFVTPHDRALPGLLAHKDSGAIIGVGY